MTNEIKLRPCPFCGEDKVMFFPTFFKNREQYAACCVNHNCKAKPMTDIFDTQEEAADAWNRRITDVE